MLGLLITYGLTLYGTVVGLANPFRGLLVYICFAIIKPDALWFWSVPPANYSRIVGVAVLVGWVLQGCGTWSFGRARVTVISFIAFFVWSVLSLLVAAVDGDRAWLFVISISKILLPFLVGVTTIRTVSDVKLLAWVLILSQSLVAYEMNYAYFLDGFNRVKLLGLAGMEEGSISIGMVTALGLVLGMMFSVRSTPLRGCLAIMAILLVHVPMLAGSRGAMLAACTVGIVAFTLIPKSPKAIVVAILIAIVVLRIAGSDVRNRFGTVFVSGDDRDESAQSRLDLWANCWTVMLERPICGLGPYHWPTVAHRFGWEPGKEAHSLWMQIGAELGFPGLAMLLTFYFTCPFRLWRLSRGHEHGMDPFLRGIAIMVVAALAGFVVAAQFISLWALEIPYYVILLGACVLILQDRGLRRDEVLEDQSFDNYMSSLPFERRSSLLFTTT